MRYSIKAKDKTYVKGYGFLSFAKNIGKNIGRMLSGKHSQNFLDSVKKSTTDLVKVASKKAIQKTVESTGDLIGKNLLIKLQNLQRCIQKKLIMKYQKKDIYPQKKDNKLLMN